MRQNGVGGKESTEKATWVLLSWKLPPENMTLKLKASHDIRIIRVIFPFDCGWTLCAQLFDKWHVHICGVYVCVRRVCVCSASNIHWACHGMRDGWRKLYWQFDVYFRMSADRTCVYVCAVRPQCSGWVEYLCFRLVRINFSIYLFIIGNPEKCPVVSFTPPPSIRFPPTPRLLPPLPIRSADTFVHL